MGVHEKNQREPFSEILVSMFLVYICVYVGGYSPRDHTFFFLKVEAESFLRMRWEQ